tara:strand:+ start:738 stop:1271 length:534 start_codon:yes stop_codon:yes gene_type:complete
MFLKRIKDKFKRKSGRKKLKQLVATPVAVARESKGIRSVGCIVDLDKFEKSEVFFKFQEELSLHPNAVKIIGYKRFYDKNSPYATPVFSDKDLGWNGEIENSYAHEFLGREYDLLVNYYDEDSLLLNLMSMKTKARLKVGFQKVGPTYNDLMLDTPLKDFQIFKKELKKYLGIFKEI